MKITREWAMPNKWTFNINPIKKLLEIEVGVPMFMNGVWCDPFSGTSTIAQIRNDMNEEMGTEFHMDALEFLKTRENKEFDGVLLDPPYSKRQVSEHYKKAGIKVTGWHTSEGWVATIKDEVNRLIKDGGKVISFGWNSSGMGKKRGYELEKVLLVCHGGGHNDTIVTVEKKIDIPKVHKTRGLQ